MDYQLGLTLLIIGAAAGFWLWRIWKSLQQRGETGCSSGCGACAMPKASEAASGLIHSAEISKRLRSRSQPAR